jgi:hypothetical protein
MSNFTRLDPGRLEIAILVDAMLRAREVVAARPWSTSQEATTEHWWADVLANFPSDRSTEPPHAAKDHQVLHYGRAVSGPGRGDLTVLDRSSASMIGSSFDSTKTPLQDVLTRADTNRQSRRPRERNVTGHLGASRSGRTTG